MAAKARRRVVCLFPEFPLDCPVTGGEKYNAVVINAALRDDALDTTMAPAHQSLPRLAKRHTLLRRAWYQIACFVSVLARPCDLVLTDGSYHSWVLLALVHLRWVRRVPMAAMAYHVRHIASNRQGLGLKIERWGERSLYRLMDHVITCSYAAKADFVRDGIEADRIEVIYPAANVALPDSERVAQWRQRRAADPSLNLIYVGQCYERKGLHFLLQACAALDFAWRLDIVGQYDPSGSYYQRLAQIIQKHELGPKVHFHGFVTREDLASAYQAADLFCLPSLHEGYGIVLVEAMGYGLPIVSTTAGSIPELVEHGRSGLLVPPGDSDALAEAITRLYASPDLYSDLADGASARAHELERDWETVADEALACLRDWAGV